MSHPVTPTPAHAGKWFEIPAPELDKSQAFYETVLQRKLRHEVMGPNTIAVFPYADGGASGLGFIAHILDVAGNRVGLHALA